MICFSYAVHDIADDDLAAEGARALAAIVMTWFIQNTPASALGGLWDQGGVSKTLTSP